MRAAQPRMSAAVEMAAGRKIYGRREDGSEVPLQIKLNEITTLRGRIIVASLTDISDQIWRTAEENDAEIRRRLAAEATNIELQTLSYNLAKTRDQANEANQAKSRFLASITHELRTPLHGILGYAELLRLEGGLNPSQLERLNVMQGAGQYLLGTINAVLDMSQIEADQLELRTAEVELLDLVRHCLAVVQPAADAKGLLLQIAQAKSFRCVADSTRLRQVLINLLGNAVKFTPAGTIEVRMCREGSGAFIHLEVVDTGPGIWARHRAKLFQSFERLNADAVAGIEGTGLGLAIAARLMHLMGGKIGYADNPAGGSIFWLDLPCAKASSRENGIAAPSSSTAPGRSLRVLVVDDEALNRNIAKAFLARAGHDVVCVEDGAAAVEIAAREVFDAILMDVRMPGTNGLEATRQIRMLPAPRGQVPVVAVTAQAFAQQIEICRQAGMNSHVSKPFEQATLLAALENITTRPDDADSSMISPTGAPADEECELPVLDRTMFDDIAASFSATDLMENLQILNVRGEALLRDLRMPGLLPRASELAEAAHKLAGGAGTFGFLKVACLARQFEAAADSGAPEMGAFATRLAGAIEVLITGVQQELAAMTSTAT